ncbi:unnamed protein product [Triticum turgidum subsp. durum]|uniref:Uncharacterized protein n=1 Tax=Triticum turgidum subsp. durum TaxID=4567 RepID=A0A9R1BR00_TRITD|nr:unnamed protein product [Triticum turgidum subsp. durum]
MALTTMWFFLARVLRLGDEEELWGASRHNDATRGGRWASPKHYENMTEGVIYGGRRRTRLTEVDVDSQRLSLAAQVNMPRYLQTCERRQHHIHAPPDRPRTKQEETVVHPLPGVPRPRPRPPPRPPQAVKDVAGKVYPNAPEDPSSAHPTPDQGSSSTLEPVFHIFEDPRHRLVDPPGRPPLPAVKSAAGKAYLDAPEDPTTHPAPNTGSCNASEPVSAGIFEDPRHPVPDPSARGRSAMTDGDEPAQCTKEHPKYPVPDSSTDEGPVEEHPAYATPGYGSCSTPKPVPEKPPSGTYEDVKQRDVDPPRPAREGVGHQVPDPSGRGSSALPEARAVHPGPSEIPSPGQFQVTTSFRLKS